MSAELDALGGGDTRVARVDGYCIAFPSNNINNGEDNDESILSMDYDKNVVTVR